MERHELHDKIVQQLRFHRISGLDEEECANNILSIVQADWTEGCSCYHGDTTGETWCCNKCGKPSNIHARTLPNDEESLKAIRRGIISKHLQITYKQNGVETFFAYHKAMEEYANLKLQKTAHIVELVKKMREAQRNYFKNRTTPASKRYLEEAKTLEKQVDIEIFELDFINHPKQG